MDWMSLLAGLSLGWGAASVVALLIMRYDRSHGYERARVLREMELERAMRGRI